MAKVLVFKHVAAEPLGTLDPMLRERGHRIRYINFSRHPEAQPDVSRYQALIILGGPMMPNEADRYPHLLTEMRCIEEALRLQIPVLGICLGAQLLAHTLGARLRPNPVWEIGWYDVAPTTEAGKDPVFSHWKKPLPIFQWHGYTFDLPSGSTHLAQSATCDNQAYRYNGNAYGLQFHLELDERLINRWLNMPNYLAELEESGVPHDADTIRQQTHQLIGASARLSQNMFAEFLEPLGERRNRHVLPSR